MASAVDRWQGRRSACAAVSRSVPGPADFVAVPIGSEMCRRSARRVWTAPSAMARDRCSAAAAARARRPSQSHPRRRASPPRGRTTDPGTALRLSSGCTFTSTRSGGNLEEQMNLGTSFLDRSIAVRLDDRVRDRAVLHDPPVDEDVLRATRRALLGQRRHIAFDAEAGEALSDRNQIGPFAEHLIRRSSKLATAGH